MLTPKANDVIQRGAPYEIQWKIEGGIADFGAKVTIEFSNDAGKSWKEIEVNVPKEGSCSWKVPETGSLQCKIRVISQYRPEYRGTSGVFTIK